MGKQKEPPFLDTPFEEVGQWTLRWYEWIRDLESRINERPPLGETISPGDTLTINADEELVSAGSTVEEDIITHLETVIHLQENELPEAGTEHGARFGSYKIGLFTENDYAYFDEYGKLIFYGTNTGLRIVNLANGGTSEKFAVFDSDNNLQYRTASQLIADLSVELGNYTGSRFITENLLNEAGTQEDLVQYDDFTPDSITVNASDGTVGSVADVQVMFDGNEYQIDELSATPGFDVEFNFTGLKKKLPTFVVARWRYDGLSTHYVSWDIWNYTTSAWDQLRVFTDSATYFSSMTMYIPTINQEDYVSDGNAIIRVYHNTGGNNAHDIHIDYIGLTHKRLGAF